MKDQVQQISKLQGYYRFHSWIYDMTRWSFLFGREAILKLFPFKSDDSFTMLEVGCGTGKNLEPVAKMYPGAKLVGYDISGDMLRIARKKMEPYGEGRVRLVEGPYGPGVDEKEGFDLILFSYTLSMVNPQYREVIEQAHRDLKPGGSIAVVDFYEGTTPYKKYMLLNHVRMDGHTLPVLKEFFDPTLISIRKAYFGVWKYFLFTGKKR